MMKKRVILSILLILSVSTLKAEVISDTLKINISNSTQNELFPVLGGDILVPGSYLGWAIKSGVRYSINHVQLDGLIEYSYGKSKDIVLSPGSRTRATSRIFPHLMATFNHGKINPFIVLGIGSGYFKVNAFGNIIDSRKTIWGIGGGLKFRNYFFGMRYYGPKVEMCEAPPGRCYRMNNYVLFTLGFLMNFDIE